MYNDLFKLYKRPSFFQGLAELLNFGGKNHFYNISKTEDEADFRALKSDWQHVGRDMEFAISSFEKECLNGEPKR